MGNMPLSCEPVSRPLTSPVLELKLDTNSEKTANRKSTKYQNIQEKQLMVQRWHLSDTDHQLDAGSTLAHLAVLCVASRDSLGVCTENGRHAAIVA